EPCDRPLVAAGVELLDANQQAIASKDPHEDELPLEGAPAPAIGTRVRHAQKERVGSQGEDVVQAVLDVSYELEKGAYELQHCLRSAHAPKAHGAAVDQFDVGRECRAPAIEVDR